LIAVRDFIDGFNERREQAIIPGPQIVVDECMSPWKGKEMIISSI
jgi:hypothetical protein